MRSCAFLVLAWLQVAVATILQNGEERADPYPGQPAIISPEISYTTWKYYPPNSTEISYQGRWDERYISWWSAPGLRFAFTGTDLAVSFGSHTDANVLVAYRLGGLDWLFANVTSDTTYQFAGPNTPGIGPRKPGEKKNFELRGVLVEEGRQLLNVPALPKQVEVIGDSLSAGQFGTYEGIPCWAYNFAAGLGNAEYSITVRPFGLRGHLLNASSQAIFPHDCLCRTQAYPGICLHDQKCWVNQRGMTHQWLYTSDTWPRAQALYGDSPKGWDFQAHRPADLVVINLATNDYSHGVAADDVYNDYIRLIDTVRSAWPNAEIIIMSLWGKFIRTVDSYYQEPFFKEQILEVYRHFQADGDDQVHYFDTRGILQNNDLRATIDHPTDTGQLKIAWHLLQFVKLRLGWTLEAVGPEIQHGTMYWNDQYYY